MEVYGSLGDKNVKAKIAELLESDEGRRLSAHGQLVVPEDDCGRQSEATQAEDGGALHGCSDPGASYSRTRRAQAPRGVTLSWRRLRPLPLTEEDSKNAARPCVNSNRMRGTRPVLCSNVRV